MTATSPFVGSDFSAEDYAAICEILRETGAFDAERYKDLCVKRRIATRIRELGFITAAPYIERLRDDAGEVLRLLAALSIHVSRFNRDPATFGVLHRLLRERMRAADAPAVLRLWSAGCAGGEEAFSLALLAAQEESLRDRVDIIATDLSPEVLERARAGRFDASHLENLPAPVLERFFLPEGSGFRIDPQFAATVRFSRHDLLGSESYPAADCILCRYVLIYFSSNDQAEVSRRFAAALPPGGFLVLGRTETLRDPDGHFLLHDAAERIYRRI